MSFLRANLPKVKLRVTIKQSKQNIQPETENTQTENKKNKQIP
jgi:hypothetical protein